VPDAKDTSSSMAAGKVLLWRLDALPKLCTRHISRLLSELANSTRTEEV
jgi:hypothetical protein